MPERNGVQHLRFSIVDSASVGGPSNGLSVIEETINMIGGPGGMPPQPEEMMGAGGAGLPPSYVRSIDLANNSGNR